MNNMNDEDKIIELRDNHQDFCNKHLQCKDCPLHEFSADCVFAYCHYNYKRDIEELKEEIEHWKCKESTLEDSYEAYKTHTDYVINKYKRALRLAVTDYVNLVVGNKYPEFISDQVEKYYEAGEMEILKEEDEE